MSAFSLLLIRSVLKLLEALAPVIAGDGINLSDDFRDVLSSTGIRVEQLGQCRDARGSTVVGMHFKDHFKDPSCHLVVAPHEETLG